MKNPLIIRQGDVLMTQVDALPDGCTPVEGEKNKIILAWGEVTGHHHRFESVFKAAEQSVYAATFDAVDQVIPHPGAADEIAEAVIARAKSGARLLVAPSKDRFLEVTGGQHQCPMQFTELLKVEDEAFLVRCELGEIWFAKSIFHVQDGAVHGAPFEMLKHEEHSYHATPPGIYKLPTQIEYTPAELRRVAD